MTRHNRGLWLTAAATIAFAISCGPPGTPDAGPGTCTTDAACGTGKGCHPILKTCVATCTGASDCPSNEKTCAKVNASTASFCTCSTKELCAASTAGNICNSGTKKCSAKCTAGSCPSGLTCDTVSGNCGGGNTDAGTDAGVADAGCNNTSQPDRCGYGNVCNISNACEALVNGTCQNVAGRPAWTSASTGPVIYNLIDEPVDDQSKCLNLPDGGIPTPFTLTVAAYAGTSPATFPTTKSNLPGFFYYTSTGTPNDIPLNYLEQANYNLFDNNKVMSAKFTLCAAPGRTSIVTGFGFTNGNSACATLTH